MPESYFSKGEALGFGWDAFKKNFGLIISAVAIIASMNVLMNLLISGLESSSKEGVPDLLLVSVIFIFWLSGLLLDMGAIRISLKLYDGDASSIRDLFSCSPMLLKYALGTIIFEMAVAAGLILLVLPGIYLFLKYQFYSYFIVYEGQGPLQAFKHSGQITKGARWNLFLFWALILAVNILGALALGAGLLVSMPVSALATTFVFRRLNKAANRETAALPVPGQTV
jgi:uncharacterized membrane protein